MKRNICVVAGCPSTDGSGDSVKFHQIPREAEARRRWLKAINRTEQEITKRSKVCSKHFKKHDYGVARFNYAGKSAPSGSEYLALKEEAVPNQNLPQKSTFKIKISKKDSVKQIKVEEVKVKEEKLDKSEKYEKLKLHKRLAIDMSPPRPRTQSRRAASKEALKQMQLLLDDENDTVEIPDDDVVALDPSPPPKKKYKLSHRKSSDGNDRDVIVLKTITNRDAENTLELDCWVEPLDEIQQHRIDTYRNEEKELEEKLEKLIDECNGTVVHKGDSNTIIEVDEELDSPLQGAQQSYQLVVDPSVSVVVASNQQKAYPAKVQVAQNLAQSGPSTGSATSRTVIRTRTKATSVSNARGTTPVLAGRVQTAPQAKVGVPTPGRQASNVTAPTRVQTKKLVTVPIAANTRGKGPLSNTFTTTVRPDETNVQGGLATDGKRVVVDLTNDDGNKTAPDSREISFNKLQGKTYPSLVVVARPHLRVADLAQQRPQLDAKVKSVLMHAPNKFTEWLIQQGLVRSEQKCSLHCGTPLKLGMYSDVSKFPYSGGYVWISLCCPQRFVSVFSGSLFEGSPHPPMVVLKLLYHWACQTNIQNVTQWVKVDNLYVKGMFTWLRAVCTVALHAHVRQIGGPGVKVEVGVISLGTTSQDGNQRQVKVEVLGVLESESKLIRLRAVEPQADGDRNYKKRFSKILEPIARWVHPQSILVADLTVDKQTLINMGFLNVVQYSSSQYGSNNQIMEYLRRIVPRMFQNTLSLLSRQIIQQFLDELVWREWFGTSSLQAFDNIVTHLAEQTRVESGQSLIMRLSKVAQNPFKCWSVNLADSSIDNANSSTTNKKPRNARKADGSNKSTTQAQAQEARPPKSTSPDVPEQMVPLENYYYGTIDTYSKTPKVTLNIKCPFCKSTFNNNIQLMNHLFKHANNVSMDAQLCRYCLTSVGTANDLLKHIASSHPAETKFDNGFCCLICETHYINPFVLGRHMSKEHCPSELPYLCGSCNYRCSNHKQAIDHFYKRHDNGPTIQCPFCLKSTTVFTASRNIVQNMNYFIQHLQKHQKKQFARRCGKCNLWFVQKDVLKDHQTKMHASQRGKAGLVPWTAPRNGVMVPKSKMDKYPVNAEVINFATLKFDLGKSLVCKECNTPMDTPKHFPSFESCQNPNCQYSTCCTNAMMEHNSKCSKQTNPMHDQKLPFEMHCICGFSNKDGNQMARHLALCERKSAYPSKGEAKAATVTHSMLDVLGLVRKAEGKPKMKRKRDDKIEETEETDDKREDEKESEEESDEKHRDNSEENATGKSVDGESEQIDEESECVDEPEMAMDGKKIDEEENKLDGIEDAPMEESEFVEAETKLKDDNNVEDDKLEEVDKLAEDVDEESQRKESEEDVLINDENEAKMSENKSEQAEKDVVPNHIDAAIETPDNKPPAVTSVDVQDILSDAVEDNVEDNEGTVVEDGKREDEVETIAPSESKEETPMETD
ncbi:unnamed protein product [Phyllotreta striolata]|uniref:Uncharacterized protein n=1 Tax=Phyllotreta striolata TaxID=444603 RepID=A0A9N9TSS5_PHYSR|nr:unnamed protein product [Phyllotreta striolata]